MGVGLRTSSLTDSPRVMRSGILSVVNPFTRECVALVPQMRFLGDDVARCPGAAGLERGLPTVIQADNGTEITSSAVK
jgi:putative transposase